jgi:hypothetical protein
MLPKITKTLVQKVKKDMNSNGYTLIDTSQFISQNQWPHKIPNENGNDYYFTKELLPIKWLKSFVIWQQKLLKLALPKENIHMIGKAVSIRNERGKAKEQTAQVWHVDGYYIRSICVNNGDTTEYKDKWGHIHRVPLQWLLIMTCQRHNSVDIPATLHRRPATKRKRSLVVTGWYGFKGDSK